MGTIAEFKQREQFIDRYRNRDKNTGPAHILQALGLHRGVMHQWLKDPEFVKDLDTVDLERAWLAKEVIYRQLGALVENLSEIALSNTRDTIKASELLLKISGMIKREGGAPGAKTQIVINNAPQEDPKQMSLEQLTSKRDELAGLLDRLATPAEFEEKTS